MSLPENIDKAIKAFGSACSACGSSDWHGSDEDASEASARYVATDEALRAAIRTRLAAAEAVLGECRKRVESCRDESDGWVRIHGRDGYGEAADIARKERDGHDNLLARIDAFITPAPATDSQEVRHG